MRKLFKTCLATFACILFLTGCISSSPDNDSDVSLVTEQVRLGEATESMDNNSTDIADLSGDIVKKSGTVIKKHPEVKEAPEIKNSAEKITMLNAQNLATIEKLKQLSESLGERDQQIQQLKDEIEKWEDESYRKQKKIWILIMSFSGIGMVAGIFLSLTGYSGKLGFTLIAGSAATAAISYFMINYAALIAIAGGIILLAVFLIVVYNAWIDKKACEENVMALEATKKQVWNKKAKDKVERIQSKPTKKRVQKVKEKLKRNGYYILPNEDEDQT